MMFFEKLTDVFHEFLYNDRVLFDYLKARNISQSTMRKYKLGAFPSDLRLLFDRMNPEELMNNGIVWNAYESMFKYGKDGVHYPIVIPVQDVNGKVVAIGCRTLIDEKTRKLLGIPKYKNSEYKKTSHLYGLNFAIDAIRKENKVFVVEGYFDVIACHQAGIYNVVATCGTLFSKRQLVMLSRYTDNIILLFDNDEPGRNTSKKVLDKFKNSNFNSINISHQFTPNGYKDIDEYLCRGGNLQFFATN